jgi:ABC-type glutathione transport system ATPase component
MLLETENLKIKYRNSTNEFAYPDFMLEKGNCICLTGMSGIGKTTLLNAILKPGFNGYISYKKGLLLDNDILDFDKNKFMDISYIPQFSQDALNPSLKISDQIKIIKKCNNHSLGDDKITEYINDLKMNTKILDMYPYELSGGLKQRIVLLMGYIKKPKVVFMDEASSAIDYITLESLISFVNKRKCDGIGIFLISHHKGMIKLMADEVIELKENPNG